MPNQFFKPMDRSAPKLRRADLVDQGGTPHEAEPDDPPETFGGPIPEPPSYRMRPREAEPEADAYPAEEGADAVQAEHEASDAEGDERPARRIGRLPLLALAALLAAGASYGIYATDAGGLATKVRQFTGHPATPARARIATAATPARDDPPWAPQPAPYDRRDVPPTPAPEPMRQTPTPVVAQAPAAPAAAPAAQASIGDVMQQQQIERLREMLANTAKLSRDTATQANQQAARLADLEQRLQALAAKVASMPVAATAAPAATAATETDAPEKVVAGYTLTGASQTAARVSAGGKEEDIKIGARHPVLGDIVAVKKYANNADWRCNYELVTGSGVVRPSDAICKGR